MSAADKSVFRYLLDKADYATAELPAKYTPTRKRIARETSISYRQVGYSTQHLKLHGWLVTTGATGPGKTLAYALAAGQHCRCTGRVHDQRAAVEDDPVTACGQAERWQPDPATVATFGYRTVATNGGNAAGQTTRHTRGTEREAVEEREVTESGHRQNPVTDGCARHQTRWGPHPHCLACITLAGSP